MNLIHGSDGPEAAAREITTYFKSGEIVAAPNSLADHLWAKDEE
jgi:nucleoside-diphosphate kinase